MPRTSHRKAVILVANNGVDNLNPIIRKLLSQPLPARDGLGLEIGFESANPQFPADA